MKIIFFGSSEFSVPFLEAFKEDIVLVVTTIDKIKGRGNKFQANPVKVAAIKRNLNYITVKKFGKEEQDKIRSYFPNTFLVVSFGKIIPNSFLEIVKCPINLHPSALPLYRGAAPIERQIMDGVTDSKICIMKVVKELDAGDVLLEKPLKIGLDDTKGEVEKRIIKEGIPLIEQALKLVERGKCQGYPQFGNASYAFKIEKSDEEINWRKSNIQIFNQIRALNPRPGAFTYFRGKSIKIFKAELLNEKYNKIPGEIISVKKEYFDVQCENGALRVLEVQPEGKRVMNSLDFINGMKIEEGECFTDKSTLNK